MSSKEKNEKPKLLKAISKTFIKPYSIFGIELFFQCVVLK